MNRPRTDPFDRLAYTQQPSIARRDPDAIRLVCVTKTVGHSIQESSRRVRLFGGNRVQESREIAEPGHLASDIDLRPVERCKRTKVHDARGSPVRCRNSRSEAGYRNLPADGAFRQASWALRSGQYRRRTAESGGHGPKPVRLLQFCRKDLGLTIDGIDVYPQSATSARPISSLSQDRGAQTVLDRLSMGMTSDFELAIS